MDSKHQYAKPAPLRAEPGQVQPEHWRHIAQLWNQVGAPLRPSNQDTSFVSDAVTSWAHGRKPPRALILGVTPELYSLPWPGGTNVLAVDHTQAMIDVVWPGPRNAAICAEWTDLPLPEHTRDIVLCDGGLHLLAYPHEHQQAVRTLHRVIAPGGLCIFRLFVPPAKRESPESVLDELLTGRIHNLNLLKLRLGMALHEDIAHGVQLRDIWDTIHRAAPDFEQLAAQIGWSLEHLLAINTYHNCSTRYYFIGFADVRRLFCEDPGGFILESVHVPDYELGERCPTVVLRRDEVPG